MLLALISDIHGNLVSLEAALRSIERHAPDEIVSLGDVAAMGPAPRACIARLRSVGAACVMGNADAELLGSPDASPYGSQRPELDAIHRWSLAQLDAEDLESLRAYRPTLRRTLPDGETLLCCHGSPRSFDDPMRATTPPEDIDGLLEGTGAAIVAAGHTHQPMVRRHLHRLLVNPGSVGMPLAYRSDGGVRNPPWAEYGLVRCADGETQVSLHRAPVDPLDVARAVRASGMPSADFWLEGW